MSYGPKLEQELTDLKRRLSALEHSVRVLTLTGDGPTLGGVPSAYTDEDAARAKKAADDYIEKRKDELYWGDPEGHVRTVEHVRARQEAGVNAGG